MPSEPDARIVCRTRGTGPARRTRLSALALAAAVALPLALPGPAAAAGSGATSRRRLAAIQRRIEPITLAQRAAYARTLRLERRIARRARAVAERREVLALMLRRPGRTDPIALRWEVFVLSMERARLAAVRERLGALQAEMRARGDRMRALLRSAHAVVHRALLSVGPARWEAVWPIRVRASGGIRACPVAGPWSLVDTFGAPRPGGRFHRGNDIVAAWETPVLAAHPGVAVRVPNTLGGRAVIVYGPGGHSYYAHLSGYGAAGPVDAGDVIGFIGSSGNARGRIHHVHFEWRPGDGPAVNPFRQLLAVC